MIGGRDPVPLGQPDGGVGPVDRGLGGVDVGPVGERMLDQDLLVDRRDVRGQGELAQRLDLGGGLSGMPIWLRRSVRAVT